MTSFLPNAVTWSLSRSADAVRGTVGGITWGPGVAVARTAVLAVLAQVTTGTLVVVDRPAGCRLVLGEGEGEPPAGRRPGRRPRAELVVTSDAFWVRLFLFADMGFAEAYMLGEVTCADLTSFFQIFILNRTHMNNGLTRFAAVANAVCSLTRSANTLSNALLNVSAHYDISNDMFAAFLSPDMTYSCPVWRRRSSSSASSSAASSAASSPAGSRHGSVDSSCSSVDDDADADAESLEDAQMRKLDRFIDGARLQPTDDVLEIGTGWGSLALRAVQRTGCRVTSLTLSAEQKALADARIAAAGLADRITVLLLDYRALEHQAPPLCGPYDKIVSIEMLEAVGAAYLATYFGCVHRLLKRDGGVALFQCITMPEGRLDAYAKKEDFINHYIFPGGYLPSITQLLTHISAASEGTLIVEAIENIGGHYAKALRLWRENFLAAFDATIRPALKREHGDMTDEEIGVFRRKWVYYFAYCEAGFVTKTLGDVIITVGREGTTALLEDIPV